MQIITSNIPPVAIKGTPNLPETFAKYADLTNSDKIFISTGFISIDSLLFIFENIKANRIDYCEITIGMVDFLGVTRNQFNTIKLVDNELRKMNKGGINICVSFPFHGKIFTFHKNETPYVAIMGSSNLDNIVPNIHQDYEVDILLNEQALVDQIFDIQNEIRKKAVIGVNEWEPKIIISEELFPKDYEGVEKISKEELDAYWAREKSTSYLLELKAEEKSNLNCTYGKGRENKKTKIIRPRPWYEVEIIVSNEITGKKNYPKNREFEVITKDGFKFVCQTQGDFSKNFRSKDNLSILGIWIKGKMVESGSITVGEPVTNESLGSFGKKFLKLISTDDKNIWLLDIV